MSTNFEAPVEVRGIEKKIISFSYHNGYEVGQVFDDFLRYIIWAFSLDGKPIDNWRYKKEQGLQFYELLQEWIKVMNEQLGSKEWYDAFGDLYISCVASSGRKNSKGQFFTPPHICDLMQLINDQNTNTNQIASDPTCGSGRTLLAWHVHHLGNYLCAEDIDSTCCMMTACNFIIHGCIGEIVWHDSLNPETYYHGWKVNENLNNPYHEHFGIPHIRSIQKEESKVWRKWQAMKQERYEAQAKTPSLIESNKKIQPIQLDLFG